MGFAIWRDRIWAELWIIGQLLNNLPGDINTDCRHIAKPRAVSGNHMNTLIIEDWKREKISLNGPASEFHKVECEAAIDFKFPDDFRNFYRICSGFTDWVMD